MRVLFLSNFYPPAARGGYEAWCHEVAGEMRRRGHEIVVLTSRQNSPALETSDPVWVFRDLHLEMEIGNFRNALWFFTRRKEKERENLLRLQELVEDFEPEAILIWGMWNLSRSVPAKAEAIMHGRVVYYMGDYWPTLPSQWQNYWQAPPRNRLTAAPKKLLKPIADRQLARETRPTLRFDKIIFPTVFLQNEFAHEGIVPQDSTVVCGGIDTNLYIRNGIGEKTVDNTLTLLFVGRLSAEKGVHTAIKAVGHLIHHEKKSRLRLLIAGAGEPEYEAFLHHLVQQENITSKVVFLGNQVKESLPDLYRQADIFLFTSIWPEPFGRVIVEAMASGVPVVGSAVGGAAEIMVENENALLFAPDNPFDLARRIGQLIESPDLRHRLGEAGRQTALAQFDLKSMVDGIEEYLHFAFVGNTVNV